MTVTDPDLEPGAEKTLAAILERIDGRLENLEVNLVTRNLAIGTAIVCLVAMLAALGYAVIAREQLLDQIESNEVSLCAQAKSAAVGYNRPLPGETRQEFLLRLEARQDVLMASEKLTCNTTSGRLPFDVIREEVIRELNRILYPEIPPRDLEGAVSQRDTSATETETVGAEPSMIVLEEDAGEPTGSGSPDQSAPENPPNPGPGGGGGGGGSQPSPSPSDPAPTTPTAPEPTDPGGPDPEPVPTSPLIDLGPVQDVTCGAAGLLCRK